MDNSSDLYTLPDTINTISTLFLISPEEYTQTINTPNTEALIHSGHAIIRKYQEALHKANEDIFLDVLLSGLLTHAPTLEGQKHVAAVLIVADRQGEERVVRAGEAWRRYLVNPILGLAKPYPLSAHNRRALASQERSLKKKLSKREQNRCAVSGYLDCSVFQTPERPRWHADTGLRNVEGVQIIPFVFPKFPELTSASVPRNTEDLQKKNIITWEVLRAWSGFDLSFLAGRWVNSPMNAILLTGRERGFFRDCDFYLDKEAYPTNPNKYLAKMFSASMDFSNGQHVADVQFSDAYAEVDFENLNAEGIEPTPIEIEIEPPHPTLLTIHASMGKAIHFGEGVWTYAEYGSDEFEGLEFRKDEAEG